jgi:hypothetical protein
MEVEFQQTDLSLDEGFSSEGSLKAKTPLRLQYEAQAEVLRKQFGGLPGVQASLGLSARKICQLLMVDPSAWSRWSKDESQVPPHIWRSFQWFFAVQEKIPGLNASYFLGRDLQGVDRRIELEWQRKDEEWAQRFQSLNQEKQRLMDRIERLEKLSRLQLWCLVSSLALSLILVLSQF